VSDIKYSRSTHRDIVIIFPREIIKSSFILWVFTFGSFLKSKTQPTRNINRWVFRIKRVHFIIATGGIWVLQTCPWKINFGGEYNIMWVRRRKSLRFVTAINVFVLPSGRVGFIKLFDRVAVEWWLSLDFLSPHFHFIYIYTYNFIVEEFSNVPEHL